MSTPAQSLAPPVIEPLLRAVFASSPDPVSVTRDGRFFVVNPAFLRLYGYDSEDELSGRSVLEFLAPGSREAVGEIFRRRASGEPTPAWLTVTGIRRDGHEFPVEVRSTSCEIGGEHYSIAFMRDRSADDQREPATVASEEIYRAMFEVNTAVKLLIAPETGRIIDANLAAAEFYGWPLEVLRTMCITDLNTLTPEEVQAEMDNARTVRRSYFRFRHRTASGEIKHVEVHSGPAEIAGEMMLFSIVHDVTERDELEEQLRRARQMESIGRLAGGIAHDFNNLLTVMLTSTDLLARKLEPGSRLRQHVDDLKHASHRAAELTNALLAFGGRQVLQPDAVQLNDLVGRTVRLIRSNVPPSVAVCTELAPELPLAKVDPAQLEQVLMNLALNARDAMPRGGTLTFRTRLRDVCGDSDVVPRGRWVTVTVADTGHGMDEATRARVFEPFFTTKPFGAGTGLGLARVYGIVSQSGGHIVLTSQPGRGSEFIVYLPLADPPAPKPVRAGRAEPTGRPTLLLVEDVSGVRGVLAEVLDQAGYCVVQARSAEEALEVAGERLSAIDLLVSDVVMPGRSGVYLARKLLAQHPSLPVILVSGHLQDGDRRAMPEGVRFVQKPFSADELVEHVRTVLRPPDDDDK